MRQYQTCMAINLLLGMDQVQKDSSKKYQHSTEQTESGYKLFLKFYATLPGFAAACEAIKNQTTNFHYRLKMHSPDIS